MFYFLYKKNILQTILFGALLIYTISKVFIHPFTFILTQESTLFYQNFVHFFEKNNFWLSILVLSNLFLQLLLLHFFFNKNKFTENKTLFPIIWYLIFLNVGFDFNQISPAIFTNTLIITILYLNTSYTPTNLKNSIILSGIFIGINSILDITSFLLILFVIASILINKFSKYKEIIILLIGCLLPYIYLFTTLYFKGITHLYIESYNNLSFFAFFSESNFTILSSIVMIILLLSFFTISSLNKIHFDNRLIIFRKRYISLILLSTNTLLMILTTTLPWAYSLLYIFIPLSFNFSILHSIKKRVLFQDVLVLVVFASIVTLEFILK